MKVRKKFHYFVISKKVNWLNWLNKIFGLTMHKIDPLENGWYRDNSQARFGEILPSYWQKSH